MIVRRTLIIAIVVALAVPLLNYTTQQGAAQQEQQDSLSNIQLFRVSTGDVRTTVEASGEVETDSEVSLAFETSGRIDELFVREGDYVLEGSILAVLENDMQRIAYQQQVLNVNRAELTRYDTLNIDEDDLEVASENLRAAWQGLGTADSAVTDADLTAMQIQYERLLQTAQTAQTNADQAPGGYFSDNYDTLQAAAGEASFNAELARLQMIAAEENEQPGVNAAYGSVLSAQAALEQLLAGPNEYTLDRLNLQLNQAELDRSRALQDYEDTFLVAPHNGIISQLNIETGSLANPGGQILRLTDIDNLIVTIYVDEIDIGSVETGRTVIFTADALPNVEFEATVSKIAPQSSIRDGVVVYEVELTIEDPDSLLRVGMTVDAEIALSEATGALYVPSRYVTRAPDGTTTVIVLEEDGTQSERVVTAGLRGQQNTEIISGLAVGELVVLESLNLGGAQSPFGG
jgi:HlyD family secretion protein